MFSVPENRASNSMVDLWYAEAQRFQSSQQCHLQLASQLKIKAAVVSGHSMDLQHPILIKKLYTQPASHSVSILLKPP
jgi:hypothetical protein